MTEISAEYYVLRDVRDHCAVCRTACDLLRKPLPSAVSAALVTLVITHQENDVEREAFYRRLVEQLRARHALP